MRKTLAAAAVLVAVLGPASAAHADGETWQDTGNGKAFGNCRNSSAGGTHDYDLYTGGVNDSNARAKGMGGHQDDVAGADGVRCRVKQSGQYVAPDVDPIRFPGQVS